MNARGRVVNTNTGVIHKSSCGAVLNSYSASIKPLSTVPANQRNKLGKCKVCKP